MRQSWTVLLGGLVLVSLGIAITIARTRGSAPHALPAEQISETVSSPAPRVEPHENAKDFLGVVIARISANLAPRFEGRLREVRVRLGDRVRKDSVIAIVDVPAVRSDLSIAEAGFKSAAIEQERADVELAEAEEQFRRRSSLSAEALATGEDLATARYRRKLAAVRVEATRAGVAEKRARIEHLRKDSADAEIRAPFDGIIAARYADPGTSLTPETPIVRLISADNLFVRFAVPESKAGTLAVGAGVSVRVGEKNVVVRGLVDKIAPEVDAASRMIFVEASLDPVAAGVAVIAGEVARVSLEDAR